VGELTPPPASGAGSYPPVSSWTAAVRAACPRCGRGPLFDGFLTVRDRCPVCGLDLRRHDSGDGPAVALTFVLGFVVVPPALLVAMAWELPLWLHAIVWSAVILAATVGLLRPAKGFFVAQQYRHRRSELGDGRPDGDGPDGPAPRER
jgi:uncharacterized protein (DUF983 family)